MTRPRRRLPAAWPTVVVVGALLAGCGGPGGSDNGAASPATVASASAGAPATTPGTADPDPPTPSTPGVSPPGSDAPGSDAPGSSAPGSDAPGSTAPDSTTTTPDPAATSSDDAATAAAGEFGVAFPGPGWTQPDGTPAAQRDGIRLVAGADHCDWGGVSFLYVPWPPDGEVLDADDERQYAWDPGGRLDELGITRDRVVDDVPGHAAATGFATAHQQLWLGDDADEFAYLVGDDDVVRRLERPVVEPGGVLACG